MSDALPFETIGPDARANRLSNLVIGAAIAVHRELGAGHLESSYEKALAIELEFLKIPFKRQQPIDLKYRGVIVGESRVDFLVDDCLIIELKAVESLVPVHRAQLISYLKITGCKLGLLINFNVPMLKDGIVRIAN